MASAHDGLCTAKAAACLRHVSIYSGANPCVNKAQHSQHLTMDLETALNMHNLPQFKILTQELSSPITSDTVCHDMSSYALQLISSGAQDEGVASMLCALSFLAYSVRKRPGWVILTVRHLTRGTYM